MIAIMWKLVYWGTIGRQVLTKIIKNEANNGYLGKGPIPKPQIRKCCRIKVNSPYDSTTGDSHKMSSSVFPENKKKQSYAKVKIQQFTS